MWVTASSGRAWFEADRKTGVLRLSGELDEAAACDLIPSIVVAMNEDVRWTVLSLDDLVSLSAADSRLVGAICRVSDHHGSPMRITCRPGSLVHRALTAVGLVPVDGEAEVPGSQVC